MKVYISYPVDLDNVPDELADLLEKINEKLRIMSLEYTIDCLRSDTSTSEILKDLDYFREGLKDIDLKISSYSEMFALYQKTKVEQYLTKKSQDEESQQNIIPQQDFDQDEMIEPNEDPDESNDN